MDLLLWVEEVSTCLKRQLEGTNERVGRRATLSKRPRSWLEREWPKWEGTPGEEYHHYKPSAEGVTTTVSRV